MTKDVLDELTEEAQSLGLYDAPGTEFRRSNGFVKDDKAKPQFTLVDPAIIKAIEAVGAIGKAKYTRNGVDGSHNWKMAFDPDPAYGISVYYEAFLRHVIAHWGGKELDDGPGGTGMPHLYCAAWNLNAVLYGRNLLKGTKK